MNSRIKSALLTVVLLATLGATPQTAFGGISWVKGYDAGMRRAKKAGKPAMLDFTAAWCGWCVKLDKNTFTDSMVQELAKSFVCVKVDLDKEKKKAQQWSIRGIPHILFLDPDGNLLGRISGYTTPGPFAKEMRKALSKFTPKRSEKKKSPSDESSSEPLFVECKGCGIIFNATLPKGQCEHCGAQYDTSTK